MKADAKRAAWAFIRDRWADRQPKADSRLDEDLGMDSIDRLYLAMEIRTRTGATLADEDLGNAETVADIVRAVAKGGTHGPALAPSPQASLPPDQARWLQPISGPTAVAGRVAHAATRGIMRAVFRLRTTGIDGVPQRQVIFAANHASFLDPFALGACLDYRRLRHTFWAETATYLYANRFTVLGSRLAQALPIDRHRGLQTSLALGAAVLRQGHDLVWFPQGVRSRDGRVTNFRPGIGVLLEHFPVTVVPVAIHGTYEAWPAHRRLPRPGRISVVFGTPIEPTHLPRHGDGPRMWRTVAGALERHVARLHRDSRFEGLTRPEVPEA